MEATSIHGRFQLPFLPLVALLLCSIPLVSFAQNENNVWHFGLEAGIDFNFSPPRPIKGPFTKFVLEGSATYCNTCTGKLLISTDGSTVWNRDLQVMENGTGLLGGFGTSSQGTMILPFPTNEDLFYIFTCDQAGYLAPSKGVRYSVVDMRLGGGRGAVTEKNVDLLPQLMAEKLTAIPHSNGSDFWVITHGIGNDFFATLVSDSISRNPVVSSVGHVAHTNNINSAIGYLVSNRSGTMLGYGSMGDAQVWIYDFDRTTGVVSNGRVIFEGYEYIYGVCFSPDDSKLYAASYSPGALYQFDVTLPTAEEIRASRVQVYVGYGPGAVRPGPDGKLYVAMFGSTFVGVINNPNDRGSACNFDPEEIMLPAGASAMVGLPNVLDAWFREGMLPCIAGAPKNRTLCAGGCVEFSERSNEERKLVWKVSDGRTLEDISTPSICFDSAGEYTIDLFRISDEGDTINEGATTVSILPSLKFRLQSHAVVTDTIGAVIKVPIVLNERVKSKFNAQFSFDPELLEYAGALDATGIPIDLGSRPEEGLLTISKDLHGDSVVGYLYFTLYWEKAAPCRSVQLLDYSLSNASVQCLDTDASYEMCLDEDCGTPILSEYVRTSRLDLQVAPNPATTNISLSSPIDLPAGEVIVVNSSGVPMIRETLVFHAGRKQTLDVSNLSNGIYFLSFSSELGNVRKSIVIRR